MEHRQYTVYYGKYRGIPYEINKGRHWTYYLHLIEEQMPDVFEQLWLPGEKYNLGGPDRIMYRYDESALITSLDWHCGCTYYAKISGFDGDKRVVKVGCDYSHLYDEGKSYNLIDVERDVMNTINSLYKRVNVLQWCRYCGGYFQEVNERGWCADCQERNMPPIYISDIPCPKCGGQMYQLDAHATGFYCADCERNYYLRGGRWYDVDGKPLDNGREIRIMMVNN